MTTSWVTMTSTSTVQSWLPMVCSGRETNQIVTHNLFTESRLISFTIICKKEWLHSSTVWLNSKSIHFMPTLWANSFVWSDDSTQSIDSSKTSTTPLTKHKTVTGHDTVTSYPLNNRQRSCWFARPHKEQKIVSSPNSVPVYRFPSLQHFAI